MQSPRPPKAQPDPVPQDSDGDTVEQLRDAVRARDEFLTIAAHELRNPMHALLLQVGSALDAARRAGDPDVIQKLERVKLVVDRYVKRATTLLDISRINAGRLRVQFEPVDLAELVRDVADSYEIEATFNGSPLNVAVPDALVGRWDRLALEQIVANLVSNAIKYGAGAPVDVMLAPEDTAAARLEVRDRGIGLAPEDQARIFGRFEQVVGQEMRSGFGVGLWLVRSLVEAHGGSITVESAPGKGATFTVRLPLDPIPSDSVQR